MIICKSQIKIYKKGEKSEFECELLVNKDYSSENEKNEVVLIAQNKDGEYSRHNIEDLKDTCFYNFLNTMIKQHEKYDVSQDMDYLLSIFANNKALNYIKIERHSEPFTIEREIDKQKQIFVSITTYELNVKMILKDILDMDGLDELYDDSFRIKIDKYIQKKILEKIPFLKSIRVHRTAGASEDIVINKINGHRVCDIYINSLENNNFKVEDIEGIKIAYIKVCYLKKVMHRSKVKDLSFAEDETSDDILIIANRGGFSTTDVTNIFYMDYFMSFGKTIVGITNSENVRFLESL
jgi:hypothetical protein